MARRDIIDCPRGSSFYFCGVNKFRGCCSTDPCSLPTCPDIGKDPRDGHDDNDDDDNDDDDDKRKTTSTQSSDKPQSTKGAGHTTTMTDSGVTHTIPNNSIVTVTRHTTITTARPTATTSSILDSSSSTGDAVTETASSDATPMPSASEPGEGDADSSNGSGSSALPSGAIVGIGISGAVALVILTVVILAWIRRLKKKNRQTEVGSAFNNENGRDEVVEEKHFPMSTNTTGTQGSSDPFAPFGGRVDQPEDPYRPPSGTFEMDGTSAAPVELPAISVTAPTPITPVAPRLDPAQEITPIDPRANLNSLRTNTGTPKVVHHWDQYKNLG